MAEQTTLSGAGTSGGTTSGETLKSFSEQAMEAGRDLKDKAAEHCRRFGRQAQGSGNGARQRSQGHGRAGG